MSKNQAKAPSVEDIVSATPDLEEAKRDAVAVAQAAINKAKQDKFEAACREFEPALKAAREAGKTAFVTADGHLRIDE